MSIQSLRYSPASRLSAAKAKPVQFSGKMYDNPAAISERLRTLTERDGVQRVGRELDNEIVILDTTDKVSRWHCEIWVEDGNLHVRDIGSSNGTLINGNKIPSHIPVRLRTNDTLRLAHAGFDIKIPDLQAPTAKQSLGSLLAESLRAQNMPISPGIKNKEAAIQDLKEYIRDGEELIKKMESPNATLEDYEKAIHHFGASDGKAKRIAQNLGYSLMSETEIQLEDPKSLVGDTDKLAKRHVRIMMNTSIQTEYGKRLKIVKLHFQPPSQPLALSEHVAWRDFMQSIAKYREQAWRDLLADVTERRENGEI